MSLTQAFGAPWTLVYGDITYTFPLLKMRQLAELQAKLRAVRMAAAKANLDTSKMKPLEVAQYLTPIECADIDIVSVRLWVQTPEGALEALRLSLGEGADAKIDALKVDDAIEAALRVTGWTPVVQETKPNP